MRKKVIFVIAFALGCGAAWGQSNDSIERLRQQEAAIRFQQEQLQRDQAKAEKEARDRERDAKNAQRRAERRAAIGRKGRLCIDPAVSYAFNKRLVGRSSLFNALGPNVSLTVSYHLPIAKRLDFVFGTGYRFDLMAYDHTVLYDPSAGRFVPAPTQLYKGRSPMLTTHIIQIPLSLAFVPKGDRPEWYVGLVPGFAVANKFAYSELNASGKSTTAQKERNAFEALNRFRCDLVVGEQSRAAFLSPGVQLFFNLVPTYVKGVEEEGRIHEFGLRLTL